MPHIIYKGEGNLAGFHAGFSPVKTDSNGWILKLNQVFITPNGRTLIVECTAVRSGFVQAFYALVEQKGTQVTLRVDPHTSVERNEGVKRALVLVGERLVAVSPGLTFDKTNLTRELLGEEPVPGLP